ncbi:putative Peroxidase [Seiridium unicorne]|uniref:Peroxidase n=1 Tax=Seiridium unicorne TaxID=138068 RepID=A0ABR2V3V2_9PEZI
MFTSRFILPVSQLFLSISSAQYNNGIDPRDIYEEMEHVLVDNRGTNSDGFVNAVTPCSNYVGFASGGSSRGEQSSGQWVRLAFHDFITADSDAGTGGLDGSIGYEADRAENMGPTITAYLSMADNIVLGLVASIASCGGSNTGIPLRAGRIDAVEAGPAGVPETTTDLDTTFARFEAAGFNQTDAIAMTACGHSLGRIHQSNFPDIVDEDVVDDNNMDGGVAFDNSPSIFDASVVNEYLNGTGQQGGLLVTAPREEDRSDLRLYLSDNNATMKAISEEAAFQARCYSLFERMLNTVPEGVTLTDPIVPMTWKAVDMAMDIDTSGNVSVSGMIRNLYTDGSPPSTVTYTTSGADGISAERTSDKSSGSGSSLYGKTTYWHFNTTVASPGTTSLDFEDQTYPINDTIFILPKQSSSSRSLTIRAAALTSLKAADGMAATLYVPTSVPGLDVKQIQNVTVPLTEYGTAGEYTLYQGSTDTSRNSVIVKPLVLFFCIGEMPFPYKTVLIVGCTSGIGLALAERMIENGIYVIGVGRRKDRLDAFVAKHGSSKAAASQFDITDLGSIKDWATSVSQAHPAIDCIVLNSGVQRALDFTRPESIDISLVENELTTNYTSYIAMIAAFLPHLQAKAPNPAALVTVTSGLALVPIPRPANYCATKSALHSITWTLRAQLSHDEKSKHIKVVEIIPPAVQTELHGLQEDLVARGEGNFGMPLPEFTDWAWAGLQKGDEEIPVGETSLRNHAAEAGRREAFANVLGMMGNPKAPFSVRGR